MTDIPIPPNSEPLIVDKDTSRANDNWYRYWDATNKEVDALTETVSSIPIVTVTTYAATILASTTASVARTALGLGTIATEAYEATSWTPRIAFGGSTASVTGTQVGHYVRIGNYVQLWASITLTNNGSGTGSATILGIPFTASTIANLTFTGEVTQNTADDVNACKIASAATVIGLFKDNGQSASDDVDITNTASFSLSIAYRTGS